MGVVRRQGNWRLEKQQEGVYQITFERQSEAKVITPDYSPEGFTDERDDFSIPVHEVSSFSEAEKVFTRMAQRESSSGSISSSLSRKSSSAGTEADLSDLPPGGFVIIGIVGGAYFISKTGFDVQAPLFLLGGGLIGVGLAILVFAGIILSSEGPLAAAKFLIYGREEASQETQSSTSDEDKSPTTPPAPEDLKNELYFERADKECEWCDEPVDAPDVHHITPRNEGGPNEPGNLIVLCPNCHRKADRGVISRSKLRYQVGS